MWTARRESLEEAISQGTLSVTTDGQTVIWRSTNDQFKALRFVRSQIAELNGESRATSISTLDLSRV